MQKVIVYSTLDEAGVNITSNILPLCTEISAPEKINRLFKNKDFLVAELNTHQLYADFLTNIFPNSEFIFASKHKSEAKKPSLTVHTPGNWCNADFGGLNGKVCISHASLMFNVLHWFKNNSKFGWDVTLEVTHHGPYLDAPATFVEIGSTEKEWNNKIAGKIAADAILNSLNLKDSEKTHFGVGGGHYAPEFTRKVLKGEIIGHILPQYALDCVNICSFKEGIDKNIEKIDYVAIDWKGTRKEQREKIINFCEEIGIEHLKS